MYMYRTAANLRPNRQALLSCKTLLFSHYFAIKLPLQRYASFDKLFYISLAETIPCLVSELLKHYRVMPFQLFYALHSALKFNILL